VVVNNFAIYEQCVHGYVSKAVGYTRYRHS